MLDVFLEISHKSSTLSEIHFFLLLLIYSFDDMHVSFIQLAGLQAIKDAFGGPKVQHALLLLKFFAFSVAFLAADIVTDISTAVDFFKRGDFYWGLFTLLPIFAPLLGQLLVTLANILTFKRTKAGHKLKLAYNWKNELKQLIWQIPMFQAIR